MSKYLTVAFASVCVLLSGIPDVLAQVSGTRILAGRVIDSKGEPLAGANVYVRGDLKNGTSSDVEGWFSLIIPDGRNIFIEASFLGMKPWSEAFSGEKEITIVMSEDANMMESAVVRAHPNINDLDIRAKAGVVNAVDVDRLQDRPVMDLSLSLQGSAPGLVVTNRGDLGTKPEIRIRGNASFRKGDLANEPLYVLDGQVISSDAFMTLNPLDIAEIKIPRGTIRLKIDKISIGE